MELLIDKLRKIEKLARSGIGGERENAQRILDALCKKYKVTLDQIAEPVTEDYYFTVKNKWENILLEAIVCYICRTTRVRNFSRGRKRGFELTLLQSIDIEDCYKHYRKLFARERKRLMEDLMSAFVNKHRLFGPTKNKDKSNRKDNDMERAMRIVNLMRGMRSSPWEGRKRLDK